MDYLTSAECAKKWNVSQRRVAIKEERLELNDDIESLSDMVSFQLNL